MRRFEQCDRKAWYAKQKAGKKKKNYRKIHGQHSGNERHTDIDGQREIKKDTGGDKYGDLERQSAGKDTETLIER